MKSADQKSLNLKNVGKKKTGSLNKVTGEKTSSLRERQKKMTGKNNK